jgi:haloacetate dehalogenase
MAVDHGSIITRLMVLDIVPTLDLYDKADSRFASAYWHWYFLIQPYPIPEEMIVNAPKTYLTALVTRFLQGDDETRCKDIFPDEVLSSYLAQLSSMPRVHAMCEDYRASAPGGVDLEQDRSDREQGVKVQQPLRAIWGAKGLNEKLFGRQGCLALWQGVCAEQVSGQALDCGHYLPEEAPDEVTQEILNFFQ